jgi:hypothetical protein
MAQNLMTTVDFPTLAFAFWLKTDFPTISVRRWIVMMQNPLVWPKTCCKYSKT